MTLLNFLQRWPGSRPAGSPASETPVAAAPAMNPASVSDPVFRLDDELAASLRIAAEEERCSPAALAGSLLSAALARRRDEMETARLWNSLTPREQEVASLACRGLTNRQIACRLHISFETVKSHVRNAERKFNLNRKSDLRMALLYRDYDPAGGQTTSRA